MIPFGERYEVGGMISEGDGDGGRDIDGAA